MSLALFPEQQAVLDEVSAAFRAGHKRVMVSAFCGFGKTELATAMLQATHNNNKAGAFLADRRALVEQTSSRFDKYGLPHGILMADHWRFRPSERIQVCSVQTLIRRKWPDANVLFVDEAHILSEGVRKKLEQRDCYAVGLSATPITPGLGRYFDAVVNGPPANKLIEMGRLVPIEVHSYQQPDMSDADVGSGGEWVGKKAEERVLQVVGDVVQKYLEDGEGEKFILFAWSIAHAEELARQFLAAGINVATYTADDRPEDRHDVVQEFKKGDSSIRGLLTVAALTRGFDQTDVSLMIDARPLRKAVHEYVQMLGRVMRSHPGKTVARVFDHSGNAIHFWHQWRRLFEHGVTELDDGKKKEKGDAPEKEEPDPMKCPSCGHVHAPRPSCSKCGFEYPKKATVAHVPGTLKEIIATGDKQLMRKKLWPQVCWIVANQRKPTDAAHAQRMAQAIYAELTGAPAMARFESTTPETPTPDVAGKVKANQIKFARGKAAERKRQAVPA
jgi:superfamily II DNA or RNA helicase